MNRNLLIKTILFVFFLLPIFSQETEQIYRSDFDYLYFNDNTLTYSAYDFDSGLTEKEFIYAEEDVGKLTFITDIVTKEKYLVLKSNYFATLFGKENTPVFSIDCMLASHLIENPRFYYYNIRSSDKYTASSELTEKDIIYSADNLGYKNLIPWVENVPDSGIGETITMEWPTWKERDDTQGGIGALIILNGYISFEKPYLYEANNRAKQLRIFSSDGSYDYSVTLDDTPNPQLVFLPYPVDK